MVTVSVVASVIMVTVGSIFVLANLGNKAILTKAFYIPLKRGFFLTKGQHINTIYEEPFQKGIFF